MNDKTLQLVENMDLVTTSVITCRKPTPKQERLMYSKSNLKFLLHKKTKLQCDHLCQTNKKIQKAMSYWYRDGGLHKALQEFSVTKSSP